MGFLKRNFKSPTLIYLLLYVFSLFTIVDGNGDCSYSKCNTRQHNLPIPFPFRTPDQPMSCGLPGFDLECNSSSSTPLVSFPSTGQSYSVELIYNYSMVQITAECLPNKLMQFNSSGTPFKFHPEGVTQFWLYTCPLTVDLYSCSNIGCSRERYNPVICEAHSNSSSLMLGYGCGFIRNVSVVGIWSSATSFSSVRSVWLTWDTPSECVRCESRREVCGRDPYNNTNIRCFSPTPTYTSPYSPNKKREGVPPTIALPIIFLLVLVCACYFRYKRRPSRNHHAVNVTGNSPMSLTLVNTIRSTNRGSNTTVGIEQATLDMYPIIRVGASGRLLTYMEDKMCPICLSDYEPKDILKSLPRCLHIFHSHCIDEWLRAQPMCPICRTMPPQIHL